METSKPPGTALMTVDEARARVNQIRVGLENIRALVLDLYEREG
jgi:hypothetical protein